MQSGRNGDISLVINDGSVSANNKVPVDTKLQCRSFGLSVNDPYGFIYHAQKNYDIIIYLVNTNAQMILRETIDLVDYNYHNIPFILFECTIASGSKKQLV